MPKRQKILKISDFKKEGEKKKVKEKKVEKKEPE